MIKLILSAITGIALIGCGGDETKSANTRQIKSPSSSSSIAQSKPDGTSAVGGNPRVGPAVIKPHGQAKPGPPMQVSTHSPAGPSAPNPSAPASLPSSPAPLPSAPASSPSPSPSPPQRPVDVSVEVDFIDEFDDGEPGILRVPPPHLVAGRPDDNNDLGVAVLAYAATLEDEPRDFIIPRLGAALEPLLDRETGLFVPRSPEDAMAFWVNSRGPELLQHVNDDSDCGDNVEDEHSPKTRCYFAMMIATHVPVPVGYKPRDVSREIGLFAFCEHHKEGIANELKRANNPVEYPGFGADGLPQDMFSRQEVVTRSLTDAFAATWLSFCPNLVDALEPEDRLKVFNHALYRMQIASLHTGGILDLQFSRQGVVRDQALAEILDDFLTADRVQRMRRAVHTIRFGGAEILAEGRGVQTDWAAEIGRQIFAYSLTSARDSTQKKPLFEFQSNNEFLVIQPEALAWAGANGVEHIARKVYKAAGRYIGWMLINTYQIPEDLSLMFYAILMGRRIGWEAIKVYDNDKYTEYSNCLNAPDVPETTARCSYIPSAIDYVNAEDDMVHIRNEANEMVHGWPSTEAGRRDILNNAVTNHATFQVPREYAILSQGIYDVVPRHIFESGITTKDLRLRILGQRNVAVEDLIANLAFAGGYAQASPQIVWLCEYLREFDQNKLQDFVKFATNNRRPGIGGFARNRIQIVQMVTDNLGTLPRAHTCTSQIDLPAYPTREILRQKIDWGLEASELAFL
jgi:hypothetical protein